MKGICLKMIIDIGCGNTSHGIVGVDLFEGYCYDDIKKVYPEMDVKNPIMASAEYLPIRNKVFRVSMSYEVLEHVESPAIMIKEMKRISNKIVVSTPNAYYIPKVIRGFFKGVYSVYKGHIQLWGMTEIKFLFNYCGLDAEIDYITHVHEVEGRTPLKYRMMIAIAPRHFKHKSLLVVGVPNDKR